MKRTKAEKQEHLNTLSRLYVKGATQMDMAKTLGISQGQISNDLKLLLKRWEEERIDSIDGYKHQQLLRINIIEEEMWAAWEKSKTTKKVIINKSKSGEMSDGFDITTGKPTKLQTDKYWRAGTTEEEPVAGDMQYMNGIMWCVQERAKIIGLYAPKKVAQTDPSGNHEAQTSAKEVLGDIIGGILKRAKKDSNIVEGELLALDDENTIPVDAEGVPELAKMLRQKRLPAPIEKVEFDQDGNILVEGN